MISDFFVRFYHLEKFIRQKIDRKNDGNGNDSVFKLMIDYAVVGSVAVKVNWKLSRLWFFPENDWDFFRARKITVISSSECVHRAGEAHNPLALPQWGLQYFNSSCLNKFQWFTGLSRVRIIISLRRMNDGLPIRSENDCSADNSLFIVLLLSSAFLGKFGIIVLKETRALSSCPDTSIWLPSAMKLLLWSDFYMLPLPHCFAPTLSKTLNKLAPDHQRFCILVLWTKSCTDDRKVFQSWSSLTILV